MSNEKKERVCRQCANAKKLDEIVGRCFAVKNAIGFCRLNDPDHVCRKFSLIVKKQK